ncbi:alpha/beta hydrolase [Lacibacter luteus]|uniref:Alpha/beta hydrolase n=1 Tax=Lacibacter luteus TaxID=2508719 RepID=A0A4V1M7B4_9BACT|nr:alpha/beta hydrolase [Lacibacter luteus]RXK59154.1 alpha/beta hydrolase [Lacibacter luteus]
MATTNNNLMNGTKFFQIRSMLLILATNFFFMAHAKDVEAKSKINFLFVEWRDKENLLLFGHFIDQSKKVVEIRSSPEELNDLQLQKWLKGDNAVLLFHCMWGQQSFFHKVKYLKTFNEIFSPSAGKNYTVISFLWHAGGLNYKQNWEQSFTKGSKLASVVQKINHYYAGNTSVLCHSMGARFFEGVLAGNIAGPKFREVILFSSDISANTTDPDFVTITKSAKQVCVFKHQKDKMLLFSSLIHGNKRIGRTGLEAKQDGITVYDMTDHIHGFQNHAHINRRWVKEQLLQRFQ